VLSNYTIAEYCARITDPTTQQTALVALTDRFRELTI